MTDFIQNLNAVFSTVSGCLETENASFFGINEDAAFSKSRIVRDTENTDDLMIKVINNDHKTIHLLCIDGCLFSSNDGSRCDCALFDDEKFCFCELKFDVSKSSNAASNLNKARNKQLDETITVFKEKIDFSRFKTLEAYVGLKKEFYPRRPARLSELKTTFWDKHQVEYFEQNDITFKKS